MQLNSLRSNRPIPPIMGTIELVHSAARSGSGVALEIRAAGAILLKQESPSRGSGSVPSYLIGCAGALRSPDRWERLHRWPAIVPTLFRGNTQCSLDGRSDQSTRFRAYYVNVIVPFSMNDASTARKSQTKEPPRKSRRMKCSA